MVALGATAVNSNPDAEGLQRGQGDLFCHTPKTNNPAPNGTYLSANMATEGFSMQRAKLIVSLPRQRGKEPDRLPIHVIAVEKLLIGRLSKCHSTLPPLTDHGMTRVPGHGPESATNRIKHLVPAIVRISPTGTSSNGRGIDRPIVHALLLLCNYLPRHLPFLKQSKKIGHEARFF